MLDSSLSMRKQIYSIVVDKLYAIDVDNVIAAVDVTSALLSLCSLLLHKKSCREQFINSDSIRTFLPVLRTKLTSALADATRMRKELAEETEGEKLFVSLRPEQTKAGVSGAENLPMSAPFPRPPQYGTIGHVASGDIEKRLRQAETDILKLNLAANALEGVEDLIGDKVDGCDDK